MNYKDEYQGRLEQIDDILLRSLPPVEGKQKLIFEAMSYALMAGGKRLRPMLMKETYSLFHGEKECIIGPFMAAIEMIHTYSLVHDDLPAMDNDDYRRGRKTTHIVFGEGIAILTGDALLNHAFELANKVYSSIHIEDADAFVLYQRIAKANQVLAAKAGIYGMIGGQVVDIEANQGTVDKERLDFIYRLKTSALIEASMMIGAILAGATEEEVLQIEEIATDIGVAFQVQDDILDVISSQEILGKPVHSDDKNDKRTYIDLIGIDNAKEVVASISNRAIMNLNQMQYSNEFLSLLVRNLITRVN